LLKPIKDIFLNSGVISPTGFTLKSKAAFENLFNTWYSRLCSYANGFLHDLDASEEVVQEVMLKIWINRDSIVINSSMQSYLFRAVRNGCMNVIKHVNIKEIYKDYKQQEVESWIRSQEDEIIASELELQIRKAIDGLPLERRKIFILSRYEGLTYQQIANKLNISVKTVENQMGKALRSLREELAEYLPWLILFFLDLFRNH
jgi:RNA polymerase sigma-70 factor, ECF subfamily